MPELHKHWGKSWGAGEKRFLSGIFRHVSASGKDSSHSFAGLRNTLIAEKQLFYGRKVAIGGLFCGLIVFLLAAEVCTLTIAVYALCADLSWRIG